MKPHERKDSATADRWMLDNFWGQASRHVITTETRLDLGGDREYRSVCSCGWRSIPLPFRSGGACDVLEALRIRERRLDLDSRDDRHDQWQNTIAVVVDVPATGGVHTGSSQPDGHHEELEGRPDGERDAVRGCPGSLGPLRPDEVDPRD